MIKKNNHKKLISFILLFIVLISAFDISTFASKNYSDESLVNVSNIDAKVYGDANCDNIVSILDAYNIQNFLANKVLLTDSGKVNADVDGSLGVSIDDVTAIQKFLAKSIKSFVSDHLVNVSLDLRYDDYYDLSDEYADFSVAKVYGDIIKSYQVVHGTKTKDKDNKVVTFIDNTTFRASGIGTCVIEMVANGYEEIYKNLGSLSDAVLRINVNVSPAPLTMVYICGQSDAYGCTSDNQVFVTNNSVMCEQGQVYSTMSTYCDFRAYTVSGISTLGVSDFKNYEDFVPDRLNSYAIAMSKKELVYPIYALTNAGKGKTGPDAGFAYEYNKLTGDKVWTINTAVGGASIVDWNSSAYYYQLSKKFYDACNKVRDAEISAGHFVLSKKIVLWMQGDADVIMDYESYYDEYMGVIEQLDKDLSYNIFAVIMARASWDDGINRGYKDLHLSNPRVIQNFIANYNFCPKVYLISTANEIWITQDDVKKYFEKKYSEGKLSYPLRSNTSLHSLPKNLEQVHYDTHFGQVGHNENGIDAADNIYNLYYGDVKDISAYFIAESGKIITNSMECSKGVPFKLSERFDPPYVGKTAYLDFDKSFFKYDEVTETFTPLKMGSSEIKILRKGKLLNTIMVECGMPMIKDGYYNSNNGTLKLKWDEVEGAASYRIYIKLSTWPEFVYYDTTYDNTFTDTNFTSGNTYVYTIKAFDESEEYSSEYSQIGYSFTMK